MTDPTVPASLLPRWQKWALAVLALPHALLLLLGFTGHMPVAPHWQVLLAVLGLLLAAALLVSLVRLQRMRDQLAGARRAATQPPPELDVMRSQLQAADVRLHEVMEALPAGLAVFDNQDRLLAMNREMARHAPFAGGEVRMGDSFETLLRRAVAAGAIPEVDGREEEWLALRLAGRRGGGGAMSRRTDEGQGVYGFEQRTPAGYLVMTRMDTHALLAQEQMLERAHEHAVRLSMTDGLTGIPNRRQFERTLQSEWQRCARTRSELSVLLVDIDQFRHYNKQYGHLTGDECLRQAARILGLGVKRAGELVARHDGAAFAILLPGAGAAEARQVAQRCMLDFQSARIPHEASPVSPWLSVSVGLASAVALPGQEPGRLLRDAETALQTAKSGGGARLESAAPLEPA